MIPSIFNNLTRESASFEPQSPEGIGIQAGIYGGLLLCIICTCCCIRRYCIRAPHTDLIAEDITSQQSYGSVHQAAQKIIHQRYESEVGDQADTLEREESILSELDRLEEQTREESITDAFQSEFSIHDGSEADLIDISLTEQYEEEVAPSSLFGKARIPPPLPPRKK